MLKDKVKAIHTSKTRISWSRCCGQQAGVQPFPGNLGFIPHSRDLGRQTQFFPSCPLSLSPPSPTFPAWRWDSMILGVSSNLNYSTWCEIHLGSVGVSWVPSHCLAAVWALPGKNKIISVLSTAQIQGTAPQQLWRELTLSQPKPAQFALKAFGLSV